MTANQPPTATITRRRPARSTPAGTTIAFAGTGTDPEDGALPASAFTWRVDFHHDAHAHPFLPATSGVTSGTFVIPTRARPPTNVWYRLFLTVTDSGGRTTRSSATSCRASCASPWHQPAGLQLRLDGQPVTSPHNFDSVVGIVRTIEAPDQSAGGASYTFTSWSDAGARGRAMADAAGRRDLHGPLSDGCGHRTPPPTPPGLR